MPRLGTAGQSGSSPRVRGKRRRMSALSGCPRIIPARAGQTPRARDPRCPGPDHPRACGANLATDHGVRLADGSSPRVRGKLLFCSPEVKSARIIPARAGQTRSRRAGSRCRPDHPRACGANDAPSATKSRTCGSSPRVRGKQGMGRHVRAARRIIPARAGQTVRRTWRARPGSDHPRACGANWSMPDKYRGGFGSSPRVRGKPWRMSSSSPHSRIIPARAGQTFRWQRPWLPDTDHPRACGANGAILVFVFLESGSSPRVRGKLLRLFRAVRRDRIIPARAGQTCT